MLSLKCSVLFRCAFEAPTMIPGEPPPPRYTRTHAAPVAHVHTRENLCVESARVVSSSPCLSTTGRFSHSTKGYVLLIPRLRPILLQRNDPHRVITGLYTGNPKN